MVPCFEMIVGDRSIIYPVPTSYYLDSAEFTWMDEWILLVTHAQVCRVLQPFFQCTNDCGVLKNSCSSGFSYSTLW